MSNSPRPYFPEVYMGPQNPYGPRAPTVSYQEERAKTINDLQSYIEYMNEPNADMQFIIAGLTNIERQIIAILSPLCADEERHDVRGYDHPKCCSERFWMICDLITTYANKLLADFNLAYAVSYGLQGIVYLLGSISACGCLRCDPYSNEMNRLLTEYKDQMPYEPRFMPESVKKQIAETEHHFFGLQLCPYEHKCRASRCLVRLRM